MLPRLRSRLEVRLDAIAALVTFDGALLAAACGALVAGALASLGPPRWIVGAATVLVAAASVAVGWAIARSYEDRAWRRAGWTIALVALGILAILEAAEPSAERLGSWPLNVRDAELWLWLLTPAAIYLAGTTRCASRISIRLLEAGFALQTASFLIAFFEPTLARALGLSSDAAWLLVSLFDLAYVEAYFLGLFCLAVVTVLDPRELLSRRVEDAARPADRIHALHDLYLASCLLGGTRLKWGHVYGLIQCWPLLRVAFGCIATARNGGLARRRTGKILLRQLREQRRLAARHAIPPTWYYVFELYLEPNLARAGDYVTRRETKGSTYKLLVPSKPAANRISDKLEFHSVCSASGLPAVPVLVAFAGGRAILGEPEKVRIPVTGLFVKPRRERGGTGAQRWDPESGAAGRLRGAGGRTLSTSQLWSELARRSRRVPLLVQPRLVNHAGLRDLANGALATVRAMTCRNDAGEYEMVDAVLRMACGRNHVVDNFHAGGIAAAVDLETGALGLASDLGKRPGRGWLHAHPDSGARITGRRLPLWPELKQLAQTAHRAFPERTIIGWDIAITDAGPILVEANSQPDLDILQRIGRRPLGETRLGELLAARFLEAAAPLMARADVAQATPRAVALA